MVIVTGIGTINDVSKRDEILAAMASLNELNQSAEGYVTHGWYGNLWNPNQVRLYVEYESPKTLKGMEQSAAFKEAQKRLFAFSESGALTFDMATLRRNELGAALP